MLPNNEFFRPAQQGDTTADTTRTASTIAYSQLTTNDFRDVQNLRRDAAPAAGLPQVELMNVSARSSRIGRMDATIGPSDVTPAPTDRLPGRSEAIANPESTLRQRLATDYSSPAMSARRERFTSDMATFEERARGGRLSEREVSETYRQINRILDGGPNSPLTTEQRLAVASQVMRNAAVPTEIRQNENTCNVTSLEVRTYTRNPSAAAALVADVATTGAFTGHDGTNVRLDRQSLTPSDAGTVNLPRESQTRTFASQLFQVTAANIANINDPDFRDMRYVQRVPRDRNDTGESLVNTRTGREDAQEPGAAGRPNGLIRASESITGNRDEADGFLVNRERTGRTSTRANFFDNADQLGQRLEDLSRRGQLPATIFVHANSDLFPQSNRLPSDPFEDGHFVSITGYDPQTRMVRYDDQYGPNDDHNTNPVSLQRMYDATHVVRANDLLDRLERNRSSMSNNEYVRELEGVARSYTQRWQQIEGRPGPTYSQQIQDDRQAAVPRLTALANQLPAAERARVLAALRPSPVTAAR